MELDLVQESWQEMKRYINPVDRPEAAESLVSMLVENGVSAEDIQAAFIDDTDIRKVMHEYLDVDDIDTDYESHDMDDDY
jgi:hypothetical protein